MNEQRKVRELLQSDMNSSAEYAKEATDNILSGAKLEMARTYILSCIQAVDLVLAGELPPPASLAEDHSETELREHLADIAARSILAHFGETAS